MTSTAALGSLSAEKIARAAAEIRSIGEAAAAKASEAPTGAAKGALEALSQACEGLTLLLAVAEEAARQAEARAEAEAAVRDTSSRAADAKPQPGASRRSVSGESESDIEAGLLGTRVGPSGAAEVPSVARSVVMWAKGLLRRGRREGAGGEGDETEKGERGERAEWARRVEEVAQTAFVWSDRTAHGMSKRLCATPASRVAILGYSGEWGYGKGVAGMTAGSAEEGPLRHRVAIVVASVLSFPLWWCQMCTACLGCMARWRIDHVCTRSSSPHVCHLEHSRGRWRRGLCGGSFRAVTRDGGARYE